jgi:3-isopropylmalate/(R)-2-methylmalate dehydratase small subunit
MARMIRGKAFYCGNFVNTDVMSPGRFEPYESHDQLARMALIDYESPIPFVDPKTGRSPFTIIVAGEEFGCGSSRETAPLALQLAGAQAVIACSFARIFFRNCVNMGCLLPIRYPHDLDIAILGQEISIDVDRRQFTVADRVHEFPDFGPLTHIIEAGGLTAYTKRRLAEDSSR